MFMESLPKSASDLVSEMTVEEIEYVLHIDKEDMYGLYVEGKVRYDGSYIMVLGSVMLDEESGEPVTGSGTSFHTYPSGISEEKIEVVSGQSAISAMEEICQQEGFENPFTPRSSAPSLV